MPYLADGTFSPDMPAAPNAPTPNPLAAPLGGDTSTEGFTPVNKHTGLPYKISQPNPLAKLPKTGAAPKPGYANTDVPTFPDYVKFAAQRDKTDLGTADDATYLGYAKEYADQMLPQALLASGHKVDKEYLKTLTPNFQYQTAQSLPALRAYFKAQTPEASAVEPPTGMLEKAGNVLGDVATGVAAGVPKLAASIGQVTLPVAQGIGHSIASLASVAGFPGYAEDVEKRIKEQGPANEASIAATQEVGNALQNKYMSTHAKAVLEQNTAEAAKDEANKDLTPVDRFLRSAKRGLMSPSLIPEQLGELAPSFIGGGTAARIVGAGIKGIAEAEAPSVLKSVITHLGAAGVEKTAAATAFNAPMAVQALGNIGTNAYIENFAKTKDQGQATQAAHDAMTSPAAAVAIAATLAPVGSARILAGEKTGATGVLARTLGQGAQGAASAGASTAAGNVAAGRNPLENVASAAGEGAAASLPLAGAVESLGALTGAHAPTAAAPRGEVPVPGAPAGAASGDAVTSSISQAFMEHPVPPAAVLADPVQAKAHYDQALAAFKGDLRGADVPAAQVEAAVPEFAAQWSAKTGLDPATLGAPPAAGEAPLEGTPSELNEAAAAAPETDALGAIDLTEPTPAAAETPSTGPEARAGAEPGGLPIEVRDHVEEQLRASLGREPSPEEVARAGTQLLDVVLSDPRVDSRIPRNALERAVGELAGKELPKPAEVNALARKLAAEPEAKDVLKKAEAAPQEEGAAHLRAQEEKFGERVATPEERAKYEPLERFYRRYGNVRDALEAMSTRIRDEKLSGVIKRILANPYLRDRLSTEKISIRNPEDAAASPVHEGIGSYLRKVRTKAGNEENRIISTWGAYHPRQGVVLAGAGWAPRSPLDNGLHAMTFVHEAMHAAISHVILGVEKGEIKTPELVTAHRELEGIRKALERYAGATSTDKDTISALEYAATNVHELTSVAMTDPRVQTALSRIKMGTINAWQKLMGVFTRLLGAAPEEQSTIERIAHLTNKLIDYRPEGATADVEGAHLSQRSERVEENTADKVQEAIRVKAPKERLEQERVQAIEEQKPTKAEALEKKIFDTLKPLTHAIEHLRGAGEEVTPKEDIDSAVRRYQNLASRAANVAQQKFIQPTIEKIATMAQKAGKPADEFLNHLSAYYFGKRALEVNERGELEGARLRSDAEKQRAEIKQQWADGKLQDGQYIEALKGIVNAPGARVANRTPLYKAGITDEVAHELVARARRQGITPETIAEFEPSRKSLVEEINRNYATSGRFSAADAARRSGLGSKWYLPLKGFGEASDAADFEGSGIGAFTREYTAAGGRETIAANPIFNLLQEVQRSSRDVPENEMTKTVYNFAKKFGNKLGIKMRTFDVEAAVKDAVASGKGLNEVARVFKNENAIVHNNGEYRYSIEFPKDSPVLEALKGVNETPELNAFQRVAGRVTNLIARGATTLNPKFLLWNAFWRDTGYVGAQIGMDLGPKAMAEYAARYWLQGGPLRGRPTYFQGLHPRNALEREAYAATGKSAFAKSLSEIAERGGDLSFENELNAARSMDNVYEALEKASKPGSSIAERTHAVIKFLDQIGTSDIMTARVAAYETYKSTAEKKLGTKATPEQLEQVKKDAALYSRRVLDYQQRSDLSRSLNVVFPFSRVVLNQTDRLLQTFKKNDGSYDVKRVAIMTAVGLMAGATYYSLLRQAHPDIKKQENSTLAQNFVVPINGSLVRLPMAYGLTRLFLVPGMMAARAAFGDSSNEDAVNEVRNTLIEGFLPFKPPEAQHNERFHDEVMDMVTAMTPGALRPVLELERNKNVFGTGITPKDEFTKGTHSAAGFRSTPEAWKWAAKTLHSLSGGSLDVYPESLEYLTGAYGTGLGNAFIRAAAMQDRSAKGIESNTQQLPFVPSVISRDAEFYESRKLQEIREDLEAKGDAVTPKEREELKELRSSVSRFGKERSSISKNALLSPAAKQKQLDAVTTRQKAEQKATLARLEPHAQ